MKTKDNFFLLGWLRAQALLVLSARQRDSPPAGVHQPTVDHMGRPVSCKPWTVFFFLLSLCSHQAHALSTASHNPRSKAKRPKSADGQSIDNHNGGESIDNGGAHAGAAAPRRAVAEAAPQQHTIIDSASTERSPASVLQETSAPAHDALGHSTSHENLRGKSVDGELIDGEDGAALVQLPFENKAVDKRRCSVFGTSGEVDHVFPACASLVVTGHSTHTTVNGNVTGDVIIKGWNSTVKISGKVGGELVVRAHAATVEVSGSSNQPLCRIGVAGLHMPLNIRERDSTVIIKGQKWICSITGLRSGTADRGGAFMVLVLQLLGTLLFSLL